MAAFALTWGAILWRRRRVTAARWWAASFLVLGLAGIAGEATDGWKEDRHIDPAWDATLVLFGMVAYCAAATAVASSVRHGRRGPFYALAVFAFAGYLAWIGKHPVFAAAIVAYGVGMLLVLAQQLLARLDRHVSGSRWMAAGITINIVAVIVQLNLSGFHNPPTSPDLFYILLIPGGWLLYRGGLHLSTP